MSVIRATRADVIWSYVGTLVSMTSGFVLLPMLLYFLTAEELGLWYVFLAINGLSQLFEFGFSPTFARNIVYCVSGAREVTSTGHGETDSTGEIDWHLLRTLLRTARLIYGAIGILTLLGVVTVGTVYVTHVATAVDPETLWPSWVVFCFSVFLNMYYLYCLVELRGVGDVAGENRAKTLGKIAQLAVTAVLLLLGFGLLGAAIGLLVNGVLLRFLAKAMFARHSDIVEGMASDDARVDREEIAAVLKGVSGISWRDGVVQVALYGSTQATSIVASLFLGLAETGTYSIMMQFANAMCGFACSFVKSYYPMFQSAYARDDLPTMRRITERGVSAYWALIVAGAAGISLIVLPLLPFIKPGTDVNVPFFLLIAMYMALLNNHSVFCNLIISMNEIPYMTAYIASAVAGIAASAALASSGWGMWGLVLGQMVAQLAYDNWRWPLYVTRWLGVTFPKLMSNGLGYWLGCVRGVRRRAGRG